MSIRFDQLDFAVSFEQELVECDYLSGLSVKWEVISYGINDLDRSECSEILNINMHHYDSDIIDFYKSIQKKSESIIVIDMTKFICRWNS